MGMNCVEQLGAKLSSILPRMKMTGRVEVHLNSISFWYKLYQIETDKKFSDSQNMSEKYLK